MLNPALHLLLETDHINWRKRNRRANDWQREKITDADEAGYTQQAIVDTLAAAWGLEHDLVQAHLAAIR